MERHKLWNDRAEKLMKKTFESWSKETKEKVYEVIPEDQEELPDPAAAALYEEGKVWFDKVIALMQVQHEDDRALKILQHLESLGEYVEEKSYEHVEFSFPTGFSEGSVDEVTEQEMTGEEDYEDPEVQKAAEKAKTAKIDSVKAQLKALQKQG